MYDQIICLFITIWFKLIQSVLFNIKPLYKLSTNCPDPLCNNTISIYIALYNKCIDIDVEITPHIII